MSRTWKREAIVAIIVTVILVADLCAAVFILSGCSGSVNALYVQQVRDFNAAVLPELRDGYAGNPDKTPAQKANVEAACNEHVAAVEKWSEK